MSGIKNKYLLKLVKNNMKKYIKISCLLVVVLFGISPFYVSAATVYMESSRNTISVGDTVIITAKINADGTTINTVEGDITFKSGASNINVQEFSLANSSFGLWPKTPSLSNSGQTISFVGGVPGGFNIEGATLFKIILEAKKEGSVTINPQNIVAFANDGKGTKLPVQLKGVNVKITPKKADVSPDDEWSSLVANDITPPEDFIVVLGQDKTLFEDKKFVYFSALDNQSGISHYEVSENGAPSVRSGSTYVLQNQTNDINLEVTAYDKAGNKKISSYSSSKPISWITIIVVVLLIVVLKKLYKKWKKNKINVSNR
jgi:hypothetical protein